MTHESTNAYKVFRQNIKSRSSFFSTFFFCFAFFFIQHFPLCELTGMCVNWKSFRIHIPLFECILCVSKWRNWRKEKKRLKSSGLLCLNALLSIQSQFVVSWMKTFIKFLLPIINRDVRKYFNTSQFSVWTTIHLKYITNIYCNSVPEKINFIKFFFV